MKREGHIHWIYLGYLLLSIVYIMHKQIPDFEAVVGWIYFVIFCAAIYLLYAEKLLFQSPQRQSKPSLPARG